MSQISIIAACDEAMGLGADNKLLCHLPADLHYFKSMTLGKPIIMGRATYDAIGRPLPQRLNVVLSKQTAKIEGVLLYDSIENAIAALSEHPEIMIIGGASIYQQTLHMATHLYITHIHHLFAADVFFPPIDPKIWTCTAQKFHPRDEKNPYDMTFTCYERV